VRPTDRLRRVAERFAGTWQEFTVTDDGERLEGTLTSAFEADGCAFVQRFSSPDGSFTFISLAHVDDEAERWRETYVFSDGRSARYEWDELADETVIRRLGGDPANLRRLRVRHVDDDLYEVTEERSTDDGRTWEFVELTRTRRVV
jgi:hypothetical protein